MQWYCIIYVITFIYVLNFIQFGQSMTEAAGNTILNNQTDLAVVKHECKSLRYQHKVRPGKSWGSMNNIQQKEWMDMRCDRFFCEPNEREGRGIYDCIPRKKKTEESIS